MGMEHFEYMDTIMTDWNDWVNHQEELDPPEEGIDFYEWLDYLADMANGPYEAEN